MGQPGLQLPSLTALLAVVTLRSEPTPLRPYFFTHLNKIPPNQGLLLVPLGGLGLHVHALQARDRVNWAEGAHIQVAITPYILGKLRSEGAVWPGQGTQSARGLLGLLGSQGRASTTPHLPAPGRKGHQRKPADRTDDQTPE